MLKIKGSFQKKRKKSSHDDLFLSTQKDTCGGVQGFLREPTKIDISNLCQRTLNWTLEKSNEPLHLQDIFTS